ncbi:Uncharacterised protein [Mycobacteroides abscessus subsp. abscessus]|nr:Uncharacterised protein [Mycobacteroides abscessus subsp. abscessus]
MPRVAGEGSSLRHSIRWSGISCRNRDSGFDTGWPQPERTTARVRYSRCLARVMPT